jgi:hypothetical protein
VISLDHLKCRSVWPCAIRPCDEVIMKGQCHPVLNPDGSVPLYHDEHHTKLIDEALEIGKWLLASLIQRHREVGPTEY